MMLYAVESRGKGLSRGQWTGNRSWNWTLEVLEGFGRRLVREEGSSQFKNDEEVDQEGKNDDANDDDGRDDGEEKALGVVTQLEEEEQVVSAYSSDKLTGGPNDSALSFLLKSSAIENRLAEQVEGKLEWPIVLKTAVKSRAGLESA
ncbi:hypothetical protein K435DRAFT_800446 [Dendrothele bispora CBS 962.96]|uniref:Uncharacterized protein n=1 Tax=Dendrothele bispora (strain CBS 962.96) TaxID=1314807 RepID=A0A4S8KMU6_DENBC|nr:hypothetical protein K435DRAFT_812968 [Dendrothele bispora CBS 962.96]THU92463.1 hypothetical protein K435DRAFT_800446 [Dendrothele bispora CBS 962.96]